MSVIHGKALDAETHFHDSHYARFVQATGIRIQDILESLSESCAIPPRHRVALFDCIRRLLRACIGKEGEDWQKELTKAQNELHRAIHLKWIK